MSSETTCDLALCKTCGKPIFKESSTTSTQAIGIFFCKCENPLPSLAYRRFVFTIKNPIKEQQ